MNMIFDLKQLKEFNKIWLKRFDKSIKNALMKFGFDIVDDAINTPNTPRIDTGNLRGSHSVVFGDKEIIKKKGNPLSPDKDNLKNLEMRVGFNMPYAEEMETGKRKDGSLVGFGAKSRLAGNTGNKFLGDKIKRNNLKYINRLAEHIEDGFNE
jgi:hypothetical protein